MTSKHCGAIALALYWLFTAHAAHADEAGLVKLESQHDVDTTVARLVEIVTGKGLRHFTTIDHAAGAAKAGLELAPTRLVMFGNPKIGTPLMHCARTVAIDLPQKALIWQADDGSVWLAYDDPAHLDARHGLAGCEAVLDKVAKALAGLAAHATGN